MIRIVLVRVINLDIIIFRLLVAVAVEDIKLIPTETVAQVQQLDQVVVEVDMIPIR